MVNLINNGIKWNWYNLYNSPINLNFLTGENLDREISLVFDAELLGAARKLKKLKIAGWGDTQV